MKKIEKTLLLNVGVTHTTNVTKDGKCCQISTPHRQVPIELF